MKIAITGGIGAGKSYVCQRLRARGIAVYDCDSAAKRLMAESQAIREGLISLVGPDVYSQGQLRKDVLTEFLLQSEANKQAVNDVVHPAVAEDFMASGYDWLESAILFDSGRPCDMRHRSRVPESGAHHGARPCEPRQSTRVDTPADAPAAYGRVEPLCYRQRRCAGYRHSNQSD